MLKTLLIVYLLVVGTAHSMRPRFHRNETPQMGVVTDSVLSVMPAVMLVGVVCVTSILVCAFGGRKSAPPRDNIYASFEQLEKQVASLVAAQCSFKEAFEEGVRGEAVRAVRTLSELEQEMQLKRLRACSAFLNDVRLECAAVDSRLGEITTAVEGQTAVPQALEGQRNREVEELLQEWRHWKQSRGKRAAGDKEVTCSYIDQIKERPDKTYYPQELNMSLPLQKHTNTVCV